MSTRLQVIMDDAELEEIRRTARRHGLTTSAWVRRALRRARTEEPRAAAVSKLAAIERAAAHAFPTGDIDQMNREIERGRAEA